MVFSFLAIILNETILSCVCWPFSVKQKRPQHPAESLWFTWEVLSGPFRSFAQMGGPHERPSFRGPLRIRVYIWNTLYNSFRALRSVAVFFCRPTLANCPGQSGSLPRRHGGYKSEFDIPQTRDGRDGVLSTHRLSDCDPHQEPFSPLSLGWQMPKAIKLKSSISWQTSKRC